MISTIEALYRRANTSKRNQAHRIYPCLLRGMSITRPNQVWAMDTTYIPMKKGFVYLSAVVDWTTRKVLAWRLSNSLTADSCIEALEEAILKYGKPQIMNTDQGSQFTSTAFISLLQNNSIRISMDGKGCWRDNVFVERLWKSVKYEEVYLYAYDSVSDARQALKRYFGFYNCQRPHSSAQLQTWLTLTNCCNPSQLNHRGATYLLHKSGQLTAASSFFIRANAAYYRDDMSTGLGYHIAAGTG